MDYKERMNIYIIILFFIYSLSLSKENIFEIKSNDKFNFIPAVDCDSNYFYIAEGRFEEPCFIKIYKLNLNNNHLDSIEIDVPFDKGFRCMNDNQRIYNIFVNDSALELSLNKDLLFYKYDILSKKYIFENHINYNNILNNNRKILISKIYKTENNIILGVVDNYYDFLKDDNMIYTWKYNIKDSSLNIKYFNSPIGYKWTVLQPRSIYDYYNEYSIYSDIEVDNLYLINKEGNIDTINLNLFMKNKYTTENKSDFVHPQNFLIENENIKDSIYMIHRIDFLSNNYILVSYSEPKKYYSNNLYNFVFCVVVNLNNKWVVFDKIDPEIIFGDNKRDDKSKYNVEFFTINNMLISKHYASISNKGINNFYRIENNIDIISRIDKLIIK